MTVDTLLLIVSITLLTTWFISERSERNSFISATLSILSVIFVLITIVHLLLR